MAKDTPVKFIATSASIKFQAYNQTYVVPKDHVHFAKIRELLQAGKLRPAVTAYNDGLKKVVKAGVVVKDNDFFYKGQKLPPIFAQVWRSVMENKGKLSMLSKFLDGTVENPSKNVSVESFSRFLEHCQLPLTNRGTFLAYKRIDANYRDCYTHKIDNSVGKTVEMPRERVDPNQRNECSTGLHVCAFSYLSAYGGDRIVVVEIDPRDVVAVPPDYNGAKLRCCKYKVLDEYKKFQDRTRNHAQDSLGKLKYLDLSKHGY